MLHIVDNMKILMLSIHAKEIMTPVIEKKLSKAGNFVLIEKQKPLQEIEEFKDNKEDCILAIDPDYFDWSFPDNVISSCKNIMAICLQSTSFDWIDVKLAKKYDIPVINIRDWCTQSTTEWAIQLAEQISRKIPLLNRRLDKQTYTKYPGIEMKGKVAGIIGMGKIGTKIAELCQAKGMRVIFWSKSTQDNRFFKVTLKKLMKEADYIFPAISLNKSSEKLISNKMLKSMKKSAILIAVWPMKKLYNHKLVLSLARDKKIFGYAFEDKGERKREYRGNIMMVPIVGWVTEESMRRNTEKWVESIVKAASGNFENRVN